MAANLLSLALRIRQLSVEPLIVPTSWRQTREGFKVEGEDSSATRFSWRIVAKRKDVPGPRFETVTVPPEPTLPPVPDKA
jgi:hypothetical protein